MIERHIKVLDPRADISDQAEASKAGPGVDVSGKVVMLVGNGWPSLPTLWPLISERLRSKHEVKEIREVHVHQRGAARDAVLDQVAGQCEAAIVGLGH